MPKKLIIILVVLGVGITVFFTVNNHFKKAERERQAKAAMVKVIVAKTNIEPRAAILAEMLEYKEMPPQYAAPGTTNKPADILNKMCLSPIIAGEQIIVAKLIKRDANAGLSFIIPENKRAVSVQVDSTASIAGMVKPGDMVDVVCVLSDMDRTITILQNIQVLAIDQQVIETTGADNKAKLNTSVIATFALDLGNAEQLIQASEKGHLKLLLRAYNDTNRAYSWGANTDKLIGGVNRVRIINGSEVQDTTL